MVLISERNFRLIERSKGWQRISIWSLVAPLNWLCCYRALVIDELNVSVSLSFIGYLDFYIMCFYVQYTCIYHCHIFLNGWIVFYKIFHDFHVYVLSHKFSERFVALSGAQILVPSGVWLWYYSFPGAVANHPSFLLVPSQPSAFCQSREIILGSPEKPEHEAHALLFPVPHSGKLLVFIYLVCTAGSWSSRAVCCLLCSAGPWRLDIPWSVHSLEQKPVIWAVFQSATMLDCWCSPSPGEDRTRPFCLLVHRRWQDGQRPVIARDFPVGDGSIVSHHPDSS